MRLASNGDSMHDNSSLISENERGKNDEKSVYNSKYVGSLDM